MYSIGSVADFISGSNTPNKPKVEVKEVKVESFKHNRHRELQLEGDKSGTPKKITNNVDRTSDKKIKQSKPHFDSKFSPKIASSKQIKRSLDHIDELEREHTIFEEPVDGVNVKNALKRIKKTEKEKFKNPEKDIRTIFVGNVPLRSTKKQMSVFFSKFGKIESIRFRGAIRADTKISKKAAIIKKEFHPKAASLNCYIVYLQPESADKALSANGELYQEHHLRVDRIARETVDHDQKKAIFIGNIPFDAKDEDLWKLFENCGEIESVRLVRDPRTGVGKGYGYVNFTSLDAVELALQMTDTKIGSRGLRIQRSSVSENKHKKRNEKGEKVRKIPRKKKNSTSEKISEENSERNIDNDEQLENGVSDKKRGKEIQDYQGIKFTDKKKKKKRNKTEQQKKKVSLLLSLC